MAHKYMIRISLVFAALVLTACGKGSNVSQNTRAAGARGGVPAGTLTAKCGNGQNAVGYIYEDSIQGSTFNQTVHDFVSVNLDRSQLGNVSGVPGDTTGIDLYFSLTRTANGMVAGGSMTLMIYDDAVGMTGADNVVVQPYAIPFDQIDPNSRITNGGFDVGFQDRFGYIRFTTDQGVDSQGNYNGTVQFQNTTSAAPGAFIGTATLGRFKLPACAVQ